MRRLARVRWRRGLRAAYGAPEPPPGECRCAHVRSSAAAAWGAPPTVHGRVPSRAATGRAAREASRCREVEARQRLPSGRAAPRHHRPLVLHAAADAQPCWPRPRLPASCSCAARACSCTPEPPPPRPWPPASRAAALPYLQPRRVPRLGLEPSAVLRAARLPRARTPAQLQPRPRSRLRPPPLDPRLHGPICGRRRRIRLRGGVEEPRPAGSGRGGCAAAGLEESSDMEREAHSLGDIFYPNKTCRRRQQAPCIAEWTVEIILDDVDSVVGRRPSGHEHIEKCGVAESVMTIS